MVYPFLSRGTFVQCQLDYCFSVECCAFPTTSHGNISPKTQAENQANFLLFSWRKSICIKLQKRKSVEEPKAFQFLLRRMGVNILALNVASKDICSGLNLCGKCGNLWTMESSRVEVQSLVCNHKEMGGKQKRSCIY